jgi:hypothetical protein
MKYKKKKLVVVGVKPNEEKLTLKMMKMIMQIKMMFLK